MTCEIVNLNLNHCDSLTGRLNENIENIAPSPQHERGDEEDEEKNTEPKARCNKYTL